MITKILYILVLGYILLPSMTVNGAHRSLKLKQRKFSRDSTIPQYHDVFSSSGEDYKDVSENDEDEDNTNRIAPLQVYNVKRQKNDDENQLCVEYESRPKSLKIKKPKKVHYRKKGHNRQKIFIYANLPTPKCKCNQTQRQTMIQETSKEFSTTVHPFYDRYSQIPEIKNDNIRKQPALNKEENKTPEKPEETKTKNKISKPSTNSKTVPTTIQVKDQEFENSQENMELSTNDTSAPAVSIEDNEVRPIKTSKRNPNEMDDMEVEETINYEQIQEPGVTSVKQTLKPQFKAVYLKNYNPIIPITAENNLFKQKQKREKPYHDIAINVPKSKRSQQTDSNSENNITKYLKLNSNRKNLNQYGKSYQRTTNGYSFSKHHNFPKNDGSFKQSINKYVEIPLSGQSEEYLQHLKTLSTYNNDKVIPNDLINSQDSLSKTPLSIYLNKIIKKRCDEDHAQFIYSPFQDNNIDSTTGDEDSASESTQDNENDRNSNKNNSSEDMNKNEEEVKDDYINTKITMDTNPIMCNNWSKNNAEEIQGDPSKCAVRPAFRDLYGYQQHLTK